MNKFKYALLGDDIEYLAKIKQGIIDKINVISMFNVNDVEIDILSEINDVTYHNVFTTRTDTEYYMLYGNISDQIVEVYTYIEDDIMYDYKHCNNKNVKYQNYIITGLSTDATVFQLLDSNTLFSILIELQCNYTRVESDYFFNYVTNGNPCLYIARKDESFVLIGKFKIFKYGKIEYYTNSEYDTIIQQINNNETKAFFKY